MRRRRQRHRLAMSLVVVRHDGDVHPADAHGGRAVAAARGADAASVARPSVVASHVVLEVAVRLAARRALQLRAARPAAQAVVNLASAHDKDDLRTMPSARRCWSKLSVSAAPTGTSASARTASPDCRSRTTSQDRLTRSTVGVDAHNRRQQPAVDQQHALRAVVLQQIGGNESTAAKRTGRRRGAAHRRSRTRRLHTARCGRRVSRVVKFAQPQNARRPSPRHGRTRGAAPRRWRRSWTRRRHLHGGWPAAQGDRRTCRTSTRRGGGRAKDGEPEPVLGPRDQAPVEAVQPDRRRRHRQHLVGRDAAAAAAQVQPARQARDRRTFQTKEHKSADTLSFNDFVEVLLSSRRRRPTRRSSSSRSRSSTLTATASSAAPTSSS